MTHSVIFDQGNKTIPYQIETIDKFNEMSELLKKFNYKFVYTDLFTGSEDDCIKFCKNHNLKIA